ncbi:hypothetical protein C8A03DRAFT_20053 [Achaetomium macrosporum]|uniref:Uncharacterized protein n=1 Tax=Achaetomium macrosporum TaxID=79813 RepID=A0AAN7BZU1_9PEZI|nr:hypothetical protein C8A03DRAFT_20053 [Achaetomium macrosporum]
MPYDNIQDEIVVKIPHTTANLPTPEAAHKPQPPSDKDRQQRLDNDDSREIQGEAPVPPDHHLAPYTGHAHEDPTQPTTSATDKSTGGSADEPNEPSSSRPRRGNAKYRTDGYYTKLAKGQLPGQSFYTAHLTESPMRTPRITIALSHIKIDHDIETSRRVDFPKNYRQTARLNNFNEWWLPAMRQQDDSLIAKKVYDLVPKRPRMIVLPSKWVFDEKVDPTTGTTTARARWVVCSNFDQGSWDS